MAKRRSVVTTGKIRVSILQNNASDSYERNLKSLENLLQKALLKKPHLIAFPETFLWRGPSRKLLHSAKEHTPQILSKFKTFAREHGTAVLLGSVMDVIPGNPKKVYNTSILISEEGRVVAKYQKIHLFDSALKGASVLESTDVQRGSRVVVGKVFGVKVGLSICYDLRFPELYRRLSKKGALLLFAPANFATKTGEAHWDVLVRARAIENQCFMIAPGQVGVHPASKIRGYGNSLIVAPWGNVLARGSGSKPEVVTADLDLGAQNQLRTSFPVLEHRVF